MRVAKVMKRLIGVLYEGMEGGKVWRSHSVMRSHACVQKVCVVGDAS